MASSDVSNELTREASHAVDSVVLAAKAWVAATALSFDAYKEIGRVCFKGASSIALASLHLVGRPLETVGKLPKVGRLPPRELL
jgi:hypothetical protein